jgi:hypothetical protein
LISWPKPILVYILTAYQKQKISTGMLSKHNKASTDVYFFLLEFYNVLNDNRSFLSSKIKFPRCELPNKISLFILQRTSRDQTLSEKSYQRAIVIKNIIKFKKKEVDVSAGFVMFAKHTRRNLLLLVRC